MKQFIVCLLLFFSIEAFSQAPFLCKDGSPAHSQVIEMPVTLSSTCVTGNIRIYYCCDIDPITGRLQIDLVGAQIFDWRCFAGVDFSSAAFWDDVRDRLIDSLIANTLAACHIDPNSIGNCNNPTYFYDFVDTGCWQLSQDVISQITHLMPCGEGLCEVNYKMCYDYSFNPPKLIKTKLTQFASGVICDEGILTPPWDTPTDPTGPIIPGNYTSPCYRSCGGN